MIENKIFQLLSSLTKTEFRQWLKFAQAGIEYQDKYIHRLIQLAEAEYPAFDKLCADWQSTSRFIFTDNKKLDKEKLHKLFSQLRAIVESYMVWQAAKSTKASLLKKTYQDRGMETYYHQQLLQETKQLLQQPVRDAAYHQQLYSLNDELYQYHSAKQNRSMQLDPQALLDNLEVYYLASKLRISCELVNRGNVLKTNSQLDGINEALAQSAKLDYQQHPAITVYRYILLTLTEPEEAQHYQNLKEILPTVDQAFTPRELRDIYALAQNYCIRKINNGQTEYLGELFELYKALLQNRLLMEGGFLSQWHYKNIVYVALRIGDFAWCKTFIDDFAIWLVPAEKENAYTYNMAYYWFFAKEYSKVLKLLGRIEFTDVFYFLDSRSLLLKSFYELDETDALLSLLDTFQSALKRNKHISDNQRTVYLNLVKVVRKLSGMNRRDSARLKMLTSFVNSNKQIADRAWIMNKLDELHKTQRYATS